MTKKKDRAVQAAVATIEAVERVKEETITLSNGVVVKPKPLPDLVIQQLYRETSRPKPPMVEVEDVPGGKKWMEENPNDPGHLERLEEYTLHISNSMTNLTLLRGFDIVKLPPEVLPMKKDKTWEMELELLGLAPANNPVAKELAWRRYRVVSSSGDLDKILEASQRLSGVSEEDIEAAEERFRPTLERLAGKGVGRGAEGQSDIQRGNGDEGSG